LRIQAGCSCVSGRSIVQPWAAQVFYPRVVEIAGKRRFVRHVSLRCGATEDTGKG
jgi:hypothetical protein